MHLSMMNFLTMVKCPPKECSEWRHQERLKMTARPRGNRMTNVNFERARGFLKTFDEGGDVFALLTDDVEVMYPKWGVTKGKSDLARLYSDLAPYLKSIRHHSDSFRMLGGDDEV